VIAIITIRAQSSLAINCNWDMNIVEVKRENFMARLNLRGMSFDELIELRDSAEQLIRQQAVAQKRMLEKKLAAVSRFAGSLAPERRQHATKGRKVAAKYRNPENPSETWAGRGMRPRWLQALLEQGRSVEEFAINGAESRSAPARKKARKSRKTKES
jgi:DNA-binding protein H-NS